VSLWKGLKKLTCGPVWAVMYTVIILQVPWKHGKFLDFIVILYGDNDIRKERNE
jgi:hypothetical protein